MFYQHKNFILDSDKRKVYNRFSEEFRISGNSYRILEYLSKNVSATIVEIGDFLDWAKDYDHNNIRQYRYKINTVMAKDIIDYNNGVYSIKGDVRKVDKPVFFDRNTQEIQDKSLKFEGNSRNMEKVVQFYTWPAILSTFLVLLALLSFPYGYYVILRFIITASSVYYAYYVIKTFETKNFLFWILIAIAILFNPITPVFLYSRPIWSVIDILVSIFFIYIATSKLNLKKKI